MISTFGSARSSRSFWAGVTAIGFLLSLLRRRDARRLDRRGERFMVLLENGLGLLLRQPARNDAELGQTIGDLRGIGQRGDNVPDRGADRPGRSPERRVGVPRAAV